ncbi:hypothetical protein OWP20_28895, partial [Bacillus paranthracis]|uniref:hypothetical protein n=2 Tax=Bacillaceae TaxID=186817 RepID=UPI001E438BA3
GGLGKSSPAGLDRVQGFVFCHAKHGLAIAKTASQSLFIVYMEHSGMSQYRKGYFAKVTKLLV